ncbi:hypothetical protein KIN20_035632 [Parelaphostrongylus tenuis]|uniref:Cation efflux protein cytoplasmic domain-containing protein n=1 Tax=Parelaphostrongylus tenuis TaxID=148309 RepID=A0AAD5RBG2_PARTN|nr:hypothetical protein KIN20_035632 [Parelaphostrongylus tenuis]
MLVLAGVNAVLNLDRFVDNRFDPHMEVEDIAVVAFNIFLKVVLFGICYIRRDVSQVGVLLKDQGVDVITNTTAIIFVLLTRYFHKNWDIVGAAIIFFIICRTWFPILVSNCNKIHGVVPKSSKIDHIQEVVKELADIDTVHDMIAYHRGQGIIVELYAQLKGSCSRAIEAARNNAALRLEEIEFIETVYIFHSQSHSEEPPAQNVKHSDDAKYNAPLLEAV